ncbi:hypothetical protein BDC45DRAFT_197825 [Circinella umbellata]|nr:hypothetical protein BDC45DRAFT_197825 [Circinella umbellata]
MAFQINTNINENLVLNNACKRGRMDEDEDEDDYGTNFITKSTTSMEEGIKRLQNEQQHQKMQNDLTAQDQPNLPSITYASADYRPPPRPDALWLQAPPSTVPATTNNTMDEDLTDEDDVQSILTPSTSLQHPSNKSQHYVNNNPFSGYGMSNTHSM